MARHLFGSVADYVVAPGDSVTVGSGDSAITGYQTLLVPTTVVTFWTNVTGGSQYTDLLDLSDTPIMSVTTDDTGAIPQFKGPDGVTIMYADAGGDRRAVYAIDLGADVAVNTTAIGSLQATVAALSPLAGTGDWADIANKPDFADVATSGSWSDLSDAPAPGMQYVIKVGGSWPTRVTTASDSARPAMWVGAAPAPPYGGGYSLAGDLWVATP